MEAGLFIFLSANSLGGRAGQTWAGRQLQAAGSRQSRHPSHRQSLPQSSWGSRCTPPPAPSTTSSGTTRDTWQHKTFLVATLEMAGHLVGRGKGCS